MSLEVLFTSFYLEDCMQWLALRPTVCAIIDRTIDGRYQVLNAA